MKKITAVKKSDQGNVDLTKKTVPELKELLDRQNKIISNTKFVKNLPDRGERITSFKNKIIVELQKRDFLEEATELLSNLHLQEFPNEVEWSGKNAFDKKQALDSDDDSDDEINPLKLVATHSGTQVSFRTKQEQESSLVTEKDIKETKVVQSDNVPYVKNLCNKIDNKKSPPERFKPNQPKDKCLSKTAYKSSAKKVQQLMGKNWEITAATPPVPIHAGTEMVSLADSLALQKEQALKLKEIQVQEAMSRLQQSTGLKFGSSFPASNLMQYRNPSDPTQLFEGTSPSDENHEDVTEEDGCEKDSAVFYNIVDDVSERDS